MKCLEKNENITYQYLSNNKYKVISWSVFITKEKIKYLTPYLRDRGETLRKRGGKSNMNNNE